VAFVVRYDNTIVREYTADLLVEDCVLVELKAIKAISGHYVAQCMNDLRATSTSLCLLINCGRPRIEIRRLAAKS
jgi:GxxExxY protein